MELVLIVRWLHVIGACVLLGTGAGIAFFMLMAHRTKKPAIIAHTASIVVIADMLFTASAAVVQPISGVALAWLSGWSLSEGWIILSVILYVVVGVFWLPVVWIQIRLRDLAWQADEAGGPLTEQYHQWFRVWFLCGFPAFLAMLAIVWLMLSRPQISLSGLFLN